MKIHGEQLTLDENVLAFPRSNGDSIIFVVKAVPDMEPFFALCPAPVPPKIINAKGETREDVQDAGYLQQITLWIKKRSAWLHIQCLRDTPGLTWDKVVPNDPDTWHHYMEELTASGMADHEIVKIINAMLDVCGLNEGRMEEARRRFLTTREATNAVLASLTAAPDSTPSGEPAKDGPSDPQESKPE